MDDIENNCSEADDQLVKKTTMPRPNSFKQDLYISHETAKQTMADACNKVFQVINNTYFSD